MDWIVDPSAERPPSRQLVDTVLDGVARGELVPGDQLPSVRGLAAVAMVNHNTVARAWRDLEQLGVAQGRNGRGVFVTSGAEKIARELRLDATLTAFERTLAEALRAGHGRDELQRLVRGERRRKSA